MNNILFYRAHVSSASMNPARSFGPCVMASIFAQHSGPLGTSLSAIWAHHYVFWVGPILGASLAAATPSAIVGMTFNDQLCRTRRSINIACQSAKLCVSDKRLNEEWIDCSQKLDHPFYWLSFSTLTLLARFK
jgi:hypothetical protein